MDMDKIKATIDSLDFNEAEVARLAEVLEARAFEHADMAKLLNMCVKAKTVFKKLAQVETEIKSREDQRDAISDEVVDMNENAKTVSANNSVKIKESNDKRDAAIKADNARVQEAKRANVEKVNEYVKGAEADIALFAKKVKDAEKRASDAEMKAANAELKKKELIESLG